MLLNKARYKKNISQSLSLLQTQTQTLQPNKDCKTHTQEPKNGKPRRRAFSLPRRRVLHLGYCFTKLHNQPNIKLLERLQGMSCGYCFDQ
nr:hypothetical protein CFP56_35853 [Quercus suber]